MMRAFFMSTVGGDVAVPVLDDITVENLTPNMLAVHLLDASDLSAIVPDNTAWTISGAANNPIVTSQVVDEVGKIVYLFLSANVLDDDTLLLTYVNPGGGLGIQDVHGNELASFSNEAVTNNIGQIPVFPGNDNLLWLFNLGFTGSDIEDKSGLDNDGAFVKSHCATFTTSTVLTCTTSLAGITVTSNAGTATISISGNTIVCSVGGTVFNVLLSNGSIIPFANGAGTQVATDITTTALVFNVTGGSIDWTATQDTYHYNIKQGFSFLGRMSAINQYVALTSNITFGTGRFSFQIIYAPDNIATTQDLAGTATTNTQFAIGSTAGAITGTLRLASGTTYALTCASSAAAVGFANNTFSTFIFTRDALGTVTATINGFTLLINGAASVTDSGSTTISQFCRTITANSNIGILKEVEILDHSTESLIGTKYNAENSFGGTLQGGFELVKYARPQGGDSVNRNISGNWHNGAETRIKPNPSNNASITAASGWDNTTELTYAQLDSVSNPAFCNVTNPLRKRNLVLWESVLPYEDELVANNFVGKTTINNPRISGFSGSNYYSIANGSDIALNDTAFTLKLVVDPVFSSSGNQLFYGKTDQIGASMVGWALVREAGEISFKVRNGANTLVRSPLTAFTEIQTEISVLYVRIDNQQITIGKDGFMENGSTALVGLTATSQDTKVGAFASGSGFNGSIIAIEVWASKALSDAEIEADYQSTRNNVFVQHPDATELWTSEAGNANIVGKISGITLVKTGTITASSSQQIFNRRFKAEDMVTTTTKYPTPLANTAGDLKICFIGDSIFNGFATTNALLRRTILTQLQASPDMFNAVMVGPYNVAPDLSYTDNGATTGVILSGGTGFDAQFIAAAPTVCVLMIGANDAASSGAYNNGIADYNNLLTRIRTRLGYVPRLLVCDCLNIPTGALRNARAQDLNSYRLQTEWPDAVSKGNIISYVRLYRKVTSYADGVHPDDIGAAQMRDDSADGLGIYNALRLLCGYDPE